MHSAGKKVKFNVYFGLAVNQRGSCDC